VDGARPAIERPQSAGVVESERARPLAWYRPGMPRTWSWGRSVSLIAFLAPMACGGESVSTPPATPAPAVVSAPPAASNVAVEDSEKVPPLDRDDAAIADLGKRLLALTIEHSPETATALGLHDRDTELDDRSPEALERQMAAEETMLAEIRDRFSSPRATPGALVDLELVRSTLAVDLRTRRAQKPLERQPDLYASPMNALFLMTARDYAPAKDRANAALTRMTHLPEVLAHARRNLKSPPKVWTQVGIEMAESAGEFFDSQEKPLLEALPAERERIRKTLADARKAYAEYAAFLKKDVLPRSSGDFAAGRELFDFLLHDGYALKEDAPAVLEIGKRVLARTKADMVEVARRIDPKAKDVATVVRKVKGHHPKAAELLPTYREEVARVRRFLVEKDVVPFPPDDECDVIETPPFLRSTTSAAYDQAPPFDKVTKGLFFVTPVDPKLPKSKQEAQLREHDHGDQVDTAVHEVYPGHHLQLSFARRHPSIVRKITGPAIFAEGWALYTEELLSELGYYTDEERLMQLSWTLVRAVRVVIDVGLHTAGMTFDQAVRMLQTEANLEEPLAVSEVKRYTMSPTQPLSYMIGREALFALRERYKRQEGAAFTLKKFHTDVLTRGTIAPGLLEKEIFGG
jgi:uncharacterized protein (DUF885 family)